MRRWTRQRVVKALRGWHQRGVPMTNLWQRDPPLYKAMASHFPSREMALIAAGIPPRRRWTPALVLSQIRDQHRRGRPLTSRGVGNSLFCAGRRHFGSWSDALRAAGCAPLRTPRRPYQRWSKAIVVRTIRAHLHPGERLKLDDLRLRYAAERLFGSWSKALRAAGLESRPRRKFSRERLLQQLQTWDQRGLLDRSTCIADKSLVNAAARLFGSWRGALVAAGVLAPDERPRTAGKLTRAQVIEAIQDRYVSGASLARARNYHLAAAAITCFGSWERALKIAGIVQGEHHGAADLG